MPPERRVVAGWTPASGDAVAWTRTLGSRFTVLSVDPKRGVAQIEGVVMGMTEQFAAPISELSPYEQPELVVYDGDLEDRLNDVLPKVPAPSPDDQKKQRQAATRVGPNHELVSRLVFSPECVDAYRRRFARRVGRIEAERRLRHELEHEATRVRSHPKEYVRLQVKERFEIPLRKRPTPLEPTHVERLVFAVKPQRGRGRKAA
jgi:hypothetical protein